ncbi:hypothetical protein [Massiliimalia massiliensis]|uniref:hypothetical protein n=1 Tax=Massiliimalia massiliensis TaxID=1852384 RepID=UPI000986F0C1|nr:hypothetical protein [Massiliimalia massiliensis]
MNKGSKNAYELLFYMSFGNMHDPVKGAINMAYCDASRRVLIIKDKEKKEAFRQKCTLEIYDYITEKLCKFTNYDYWHYELCEKLHNIYNNETKIAGSKDNHVFTYGHAQKWVNMTMKYLYLFYHLIKDNPDFPSELFNYDGMEIRWDATISDLIRNNYKYFHAPIDSFVLKTLKKDFGLTLGDTSWSKCDDYDKYKKLQDNLRNELNGIPPLDWEGPVWIKTANQYNNYK